MNDDKVVFFLKKENTNINKEEDTGDDLWACLNCDTMLFKLLGSGKIECGICGTHLNNLIVVETL